MKLKKLKNKKNIKNEKNNNGYYVDPKKFKQELENFYKTDILTNELAIYICNIAERMSYMPNFINYSFKAEMIGDAKIKCFKALREKKFDINKHNPFAYFSKICFHAFVNRIKLENKEHRSIKEYQERIYDELISSNYKLKNYILEEDND